MTEWLIDQMIDWLVSSLIDRLIDFLEHVTDWLAEEELTPQSKMLVTNLKTIMITTIFPVIFERRLEY